MSEQESRNVEWEYLMWLCSLAGLDSDDREEGYWSLGDQLYQKTFEWRVLNDDNRFEDGLYLRVLFHNEFGGQAIYGDTNMLELMVVLAKRMSFEMSEESEDPAYWFHILLDNVGLERFTDDHYFNNHNTVMMVNDILDRIITRSYDPDGSGGFFPQKFPREDQRSLELWFQLSDYILERSGY